MVLNAIPFTSWVGTQTADPLRIIRGVTGLGWSAWDDRVGGASQAIDPDHDGGPAEATSDEKKRG